MSAPGEPPVQRVLQLFATAPYPCSYLPGRQARSQVVVPESAVDGAAYAQLLAMGFRHSGPATYRPWCDACRACTPLRIDALDFAPNRSQRRAWRQHADLQVRLLPLRFDAEHYALYRAYQRARHGGGSMDVDEPEDYRNFLLRSPVTSMLAEFRRGDALVMVTVLDVLPQALSAVYTFFADEPRSSFGTYSILWLIEHARATGRRHVYLGYWIADSQTMAYKSRFRPHERLLQGRWMRFD